MYSVPLGELPPLVTAFSGRDELTEEIVETIVGYAEVHKPVTLVGPDGIGKTSIALAILHHDRIERRFGENLTPSPATSSLRRSLISSVGFPKPPVQASRTPRV
jgi:hypothetical protein